MAGVKSFAEKHNVSGIAMQLAYLTRSDFTYDGNFTNTINLTVKDSQNKNESYDSTAQTSNITSSVTVTGIPNTMQFMKRDQVTLAPLSGAQFTIRGTDEGDNDVSSYSTTVTSDKNGIVKVGNLQSGIYAVNETKAPAGYSVDSNTYYFKINVMELLLV